MATTAYSTTEKHIRYDREARDWSATVTVDGVDTYLGSREHPWEAEQLCDDYVYTLLSTLPADPIPDDPITVSDQQIDGETYTTYAAGHVALDIHDGQLVSGALLGTAVDFSPTDLADLRALSFLLEHPDVRALIGRTVPVASIAIVPLIERDTCNQERATEELGIDYRLHDTMVFVSRNPAEPPVLYAFGGEEVPLDQAQQTAADILTLLHSPMVRRACARRSVGLPLRPQQHAA